MRGSRCAGGAEGDPGAGQRGGRGVAPQLSRRAGAAGKGAHPGPVLGGPGEGKGAAAACPSAEYTGV